MNTTHEQIDAHNGSGCIVVLDYRPFGVRRAEPHWIPCNYVRGTDYNRPMRYWLIHWLLSGVALLIVARIVPGIQVDGFGAALIAALVVGLVGATVGLLLKIVLLPFIILTLGLVYFLINGLTLKLASAVVPGFRVNGCLPAVLGSILLTIVDYILIRLAGI
jgi:putative membrane protein